jgi:putative phage-type endonuclease
MLRFVPKNKEDWLAWRRQGIGASDAAALLGLSPFETELSLYEKIVNGKKVFETVHMKKGKEIEEIIFPKIEAMLGFELEEQVCARHETCPYLQCTFDGLSEENGVVVEIKYVSDRSRFLNMKQIPVYHQTQMQQQMLIANLSNGIYVYTHDGIDIRMMCLSADEALQDRLISEATRFWTEHVEKKIPPTIYKKKEDLPEKRSVAFKRRCLRLRKLKPRIEKLLLEEGRIKEELRSMSDESFQCAGVRFQIIPSPGRVRYKELFEELEKFPEVARILQAVDMSLFRGGAGESIRVYVEEEKENGS